MKGRILVADHTALQPQGRSKWKALAECGWTVHILVPDRWTENYRTIEAEMGDMSPEDLSVGRVVWPGYENRAFYRSGLGAALAQARPDVVLTMSERFSLFTAQISQALAWRSPQVPFAFYAWDNLSTRSWVPYRPARFYRLTGRLGNRARCALAASTEAAEVLSRSGYPGRIEVVPYCVEIATGPPERSPSRDSFVIGYAGRLLKEKGIDVLIEAGRILLKEGVRVDIRIAGDGPARSELEMQAIERGVPIRFDGLVGRDEIPQWFSSCDVLALPSRTTPRWKEQFGRVLVEAMARGVVPIGSDSGAIPEVIDDAGIVTPEGDARALASAIRDLRDSNVRLKAFRERGFRRARDEYGVQRFAERISDTLEELL